MIESGLDAGHRACAGCGLALAARIALGAAGPQVIIANATGCLEVFSATFPESAWPVPWIHSLFENAAAVASGIEVAMRVSGREDVRVIAQAGDGGTADIGLQCLSGMWERGHRVLYICYDNEAYMNTGVQRSGLTPRWAGTATSPAGRVAWGNPRPKKDMPAIAVAHAVPYVATASAGYTRDLAAKVKRALAVEGPSYIHVHSPCPPGWAFDSSLSVKLARLAVQTGLFPLFEMRDGELVSVKRLGKRPPVSEYLKLQGRFRHLFKSEAGQEAIAQIQVFADENVRRLGLVPEPVETAA